MRRLPSGGQSLGAQQKKTRSATRNLIICISEVRNTESGLLHIVKFKLTECSERVHLLAHILRMVMEPVEKQHPDIKKLNLNVKKLEETTVEALSSFFVETEANADKRPFLDEVFQVARQEERYRNNELGKSSSSSPTSQLIDA